MNAVLPPGDKQPDEIVDRRKLPERRGWQRRKTLKSGQIVCRNGDSSDCVVSNLSESGAQLKIHGPTPNSFDLVVDGERRSCSVIWRKDNRVGVQFPEHSKINASVKSSAKQIADFKYYSATCRMLAERAGAADRVVLLEMAEAWTTATRLIRGDAP